MVVDRAPVPRTAPRPVATRRGRASGSGLFGNAPWRGSAEAWLVADERVEPLLVEVSPVAQVAARPLPWSGRGRFELPRTIRLGATEVAAAVGEPAKK